MRTLVARVSDTDWRVRAAAMDLLAKAQPGEAPPILRDSPIEERERWLLGWLAAHDKETNEVLLPDLCELYADTPCVEFGPDVVARCLTCHAGAAPAAPALADTCRKCHEAIHGDWANSSHAQSLTHLVLMTVDQKTREPRQVDFGEVRGIGCMECHRTLGKEAAVMPADGSRGTKCPFQFDPKQPAADSCARCHDTTFAEWKLWRGGRQPRRAVWPPGQIDVEFQGDTRDCAACHMPKRGEKDAAGPRQHDWSARRNLELLRGGIDVAATSRVKDTGRQQAKFVFTNLAGHSYPTGTRRRAVRLLAGPGDEEPRPVVTLAPYRAGSPSMVVQPSLQPGDQRTFDLPLPPATNELIYRIIYYRDAADPKAYTIDVLSGTIPVGQ
jgi:hypothetical protein